MNSTQTSTQPSTPVKPSKAWLIGQALLFQGLWLACVLGTNNWLWLGAALLCVHLLLSPTRWEDFVVMALGFLTFSVDQLLAVLGLYQFASFPMWLLLLWFGFVLNMGHSLAFLRRLDKRWVALIGAVGGVYAYLLSWQLGAVVLPYGGVISGTVIALVWAAMLPCLTIADVKVRQSIAYTPASAKT